MVSIPHPRSKTARTAVGLLRGDSTTARGLRLALGTAAFAIPVQLYFRLSLTYLIDGIALGSLYGVIAVGLILIYRTNRIINFAAAALGAVPAIFALLLDVQRGFNYLIVLPIAVIGGPLIAGLTDILVMRRFARSPRLITTRVTLGAAQGF